MNIVPISDIVEINQVLSELNLAYKIHLRDACGHQSLWIEALDNVKTDTSSVISVVTDFFEKKGFSLKFDDDMINFWIL